MAFELLYVDNDLFKGTTVFWRYTDLVLSCEKTEYFVNSKELWVVGIVGVYCPAAEIPFKISKHFSSSWEEHFYENH